VTESYARGDADDARVESALAAVRPRHAFLSVEAVHIVDVSADQRAKTITWVPVASIPLG
jgi:hypothetical protein